MKFLVLGLAFGLLALGCESAQSKEQREARYDDQIKSGPALALAKAPRKKDLDLTPRNFCRGVGNALEYTKQNFNAEIGALCNSDLRSTQLLDELFANPYAGGDRPQVRELVKREETGIEDHVQLMVAYSLSINKKSVPLLLAEEPYVKQANYDEDGFKISFEFQQPPPKNEGDCDTGFAVKQFASRRGDRVEFDDESLHALRLYRLHENNFDFLLAARTLMEPSEQFKHSVALRGVIADPNDSGKAISISIMNFLMNGRGEEEELINTVLEYVKSDMVTVYQYHNGG